MHVLRIAKILCQNFFTFEVTYISKPKALIDSNNFIGGQNYKVKLLCSQDSLTLQGEVTL